MSCSGGGRWHESCKSDTVTDRPTLPLASESLAVPTANLNVEDGVAPPWRCQACVKKDQYAVQRVLGGVRLGASEASMANFTCFWSTWDIGILNLKFRVGWRVG
jgi:hypothetical protein